MLGWQLATAVGVVLVAIILAVPVILALLRYYTASRHRTRVTQAAPPPRRSRQQRTALTSKEIAEILESVGISGSDNSAATTTKTIKSNLNNLFRRGQSTKPLFSWADHPSLITDAFENGWSRFGFTGYSSSSSGLTRSTLLGLVGELQTSQNLRETPVEISWEIGDGSDDFMQKVRLNSGLKKVGSGGSSVGSARSTIKTALPLPGPSVGNSFPQEAYFEVTVLAYSSRDVNEEGDKVKLINSDESAPSDNNNNNSNKTPKNGSVRSLEELKLGSNRGGNNGGDKGGHHHHQQQQQQVMISIGLASSSFNPHKIPGAYKGSIGFNSDGSVNLDGMKLVFESEKFDWGQESRSIGCGYDPRHKRVFYTIDGELIHVINCKSDEFETPLYPVLAANADVTVLINMGQSKFRYDPANATRTPNPCFELPLASSNAALVGYEDSGELFSMGRIDPTWLNSQNNALSVGSAVSGGGVHYHRRKGEGNGGDEEDESDGTDFFEIVLDVNNSEELGRRG